jgi:glycyl-tRNA synthetase
MKLAEEKSSSSWREKHNKQNHTGRSLRRFNMDVYETISDLGKRRGILFPSFEIYGGIGGFYDYGPIGALLKHNIENKWRKMFVYREGMVELESSIITLQQVFQASGHLAHFTDMMTSCAQCGRAYRTEILLNEIGIKCAEGSPSSELDEQIKSNNVRCPECKGRLTESKPFNLMFQGKIGPYGKAVTGYGRPEAAQGQFVDFKRIYAAEREKLPLGIAQIGRCIRNEIAPRKGPIRLREFTIIDYEIFVDPQDTSYPRIKELENDRLRILTIEAQRTNMDTVSEVTVREALDSGIVENEVLCYFMALATKFLKQLGIPPEKQRLREALPEERAHYSLQTFDQEIWLSNWGWTEISGHAYRTDYDLRNHMAHSGVDLRVYKTFDKPRKVTKYTVKPRIQQIKQEFNKEADRIIRLLRNSDATIIHREIQTKGFYELTGKHPLRLSSKYVEITQDESEENGRFFIPHVIEPSFGIDRIVYAVLEYAYSEKKKRVVLRLPKDIAAVKVAVFPLVNKDKLPEIARNLYEMLLNEEFIVHWDESRSIGRRYARADEIGIPICVTVDYQTLQDETVTLRDVYTWKQIRVNKENLPYVLKDYFKGKLKFEEMKTEE